MTTPSYTKLVAAYPKDIAELILSAFATVENGNNTYDLKHIVDAITANLAIDRELFAQGGNATTGFIPPTTQAMVDEYFVKEFHKYIKMILAGSSGNSTYSNFFSSDASRLNAAVDLIDKINAYNIDIDSHVRQVEFNPFAYIILAATGFLFWKFLKK